MAASDAGGALAGPLPTAPGPIRAWFGRAGGRETDASSYPLRLTLPLFAFFLAFFVTPLLILLWMSLQADTAMTHLGLAQYVKFLGDRFSLGVLGATLWLGVEVTLVCLVLGLPLAWLFIRSPGWARSALMLIVLLPLLTSVVVRTFAWIVILGRQGIVNEMLLGLGIVATPLRLLYTERGLVAALAQVQMPLMVLPLITALTRIPPNLTEASSALGAGQWRTFFRITLPLSLPGIVAGCLLTYAASITAFITQTLVGGGQMLFMPMYIYQQASSLQNWPFASAISMLFLAAVMLVVWLFNRLARLSRDVAHA